MKKNSKNSFKEIDDFFSSPPTPNQKAWGIINEFYHLILTYMEKNNIKKADLARKLGKSRSAVSQMFNKTPNVTIKKIVEISEAVGLDIDITSRQIETRQNIRNTEENKYDVIDLTFESALEDMSTIALRKKEERFKANISANSPYGTYSGEKIGIN